MTPRANLVDTHVHLNSDQFQADREAVIARARESGVNRFVVPGFDLASSAAAIGLAETMPDIHPTVGVHPHDASQWQADGPALRALAEHPAVCALGEMGLDFYRNLSSENDQRTAFRAQLALALELGKPVVIHDREAHDAILEELSLWSAAVAHSGALDHPFGVMHCFSGDRAMAERCIDLGFLISIAGPLTYPKADRLAEVVRHVPLSCLLVETDAPYLPPQPWRGRRNEPAYMRVTAEAVACLKQVSLEEVARVCTENAQRLFRLPSAVATAR